MQSIWSKKIHMAEYVLMKPSEQVPTPGNTIFITMWSNNEAYS